jgi:hypothetical protein
MFFLSFTPDTSGVSKVEEGVLLCETLGCFCFAKHSSQSSSTFDKFFFGCFSKDFSQMIQGAQFVPPNIHHGQTILLNG